MKSMPRAKEGRWAPTCVVAVLIAAGCRAPSPPPFPNWLSEEKPTISPAEREGFKKCVRIAEEAAERTKEYASRVNFTPIYRERIVERLTPLISEMRGVVAGPFGFDFSPEHPGQQKTFRRGFLMLGKALEWRIDRKAREGEFDAAVADCVTAIALGIRLNGGGAIDADLGLTIADDARKALAPHLMKLSSGNLERLYAGVRSALENRPPLAAAIRNERLNMLAGVQWVQDAYRDHRLKSIEKALRSDVSDAADYLERIRKDDTEKRPEYFRGFADEAERWYQHFLKLASLNARQRAKVSEPVLEEERPWRRFAKHLFQSSAPLFSRRDATLARTRLLALQAALLARVKRLGGAPNDLFGFPESLIVDPYSGEPFVYRTEGRVFRIYSVGSDFKDDGGETDEARSMPDLKLEGGRP